MQWELNTDKPVYLQLMEYIKADIITGVYKPGDKLPSVRELGRPSHGKSQYNAKSLCRTRTGGTGLF